MKSVLPLFAVLLFSCGESKPGSFWIVENPTYKDQEGGIHSALVDVASENGNTIVEVHFRGKVKANGDRHVLKSEHFVSALTPHKVEADWSETGFVRIVLIDRSGQRIGKKLKLK